MSGNNGCPNDENDWERGYDQAVKEVLDEVNGRDPSLVAALRQKYPEWDAIMRRRGRSEAERALDHFISGEPMKDFEG